MQDTGNQYKYEVKTYKHADQKNKKKQQHTTQMYYKIHIRCHLINYNYDINYIA